jgi:hypothetical protein
VVALDDAGFLELAHTAQARRRRDADAIGELHIGHAAIGLQFPEDLYIDDVEFRTPHIIAFL